MTADTEPQAQLNVDSGTVESFGNQWARYSQADADQAELQALFDRYFSLLDWQSLPDSVHAFDMGCGTGRWARLVAPRVDRLVCIDASREALEVARSNLSKFENCSYLSESVGSLSIAESSMDFGYSIGVLHHVPDTQAAIKNCVSLLKPGAPLLLYLYYNFDNRPIYYQLIWRASELIRWCISSSPVFLRNAMTELVAALVYFPLARLGWLLDKVGLNVNNLPLSDYRDATYYRMRHNARDRFGTPLEQRFSRIEIAEMMSNAGLTNISFRDGPPYWCAIGYRTK